MGSSASDNPFLSEPDEDATCYACGDSFEHTPTVVQSGTPAGELLRLDHDRMVEVCDSCMKWIAEQTIGDIYAVLKARGIDVEDSPAVAQTDRSAE